MSVQENKSENVISLTHVSIVDTDSLENSKPGEL